VSDQDSIHNFGRETFVICSLVRPRGRRKNFMKMDLGKISGEKCKWIELAEFLIV
jgi:hypothetical protein